jgi:hypothetical protein
VAQSTELGRCSNPARTVADLSVGVDDAAGLFWRQLIHGRAVSLVVRHLNEARADLPALRRLLKGPSRCALQIGDGTMRRNSIWGDCWMPIEVRILRPSQGL